MTEGGVRSNLSFVADCSIAEARKILPCRVHREIQPDVAPRTSSVGIVFCLVLFMVSQAYSRHPFSYLPDWTARRNTGVKQESFRKSPRMFSGSTLGGMMVAVSGKPSQLHAR
jgi:hypothetical protein